MQRLSSLRRFDMQSFYVHVVIYTSQSIFHVYSHDSIGLHDCLDGQIKLRKQVIIHYLDWVCLAQSPL